MRDITDNDKLVRARDGHISVETRSGTELISIEPVSFGDVIEASEWLDRNEKRLIASGLTGDVDNLLYGIRRSNSGQLAFYPFVK